MPTAQVNGIDLYYEDQGSGEPLLLIMGFTAHSMLWAMQTPTLSQRFRVITFDNRGVGRSSDPPAPEGVSAQAEACRAHLFGDALDRLPGITAPALVLVGAEDILTPPVYSREMAERIPGAQLKVLEHGGHGMPIEYAQAVNDE